MARDWTIGVDITDIVGVAEGDADNNDAIAVCIQIHYKTCSTFYIKRQNEPNLL